MENDVESSAYKRRYKHTRGDKSQLTDVLKGQLKRLNRIGLEVLRSFIYGKGNKLPFEFLELTFNEACQNIVLKEANGYANFCTKKNPFPPQEARHRNEKAETGLSEVPSELRPDGSKVYAFQRKHLFGVIGILITAGITRKRRLSDHWGVGLHDNYALVRKCMPRNLFFHFYSRFFHMAPVIQTLPKTDPEYDSKHHVRAFKDDLDTRWSSLVEHQHSHNTRRSSGGLCSIKSLPKLSATPTLYLTHG